MYTFVVLLFMLPMCSMCTHAHTHTHTHTNINIHAKPGSPWWIYQNSCV